jgi:hypothetical protein
MRVRKVSLGWRGVQVAGARESREGWRGEVWDWWRLCAWRCSSVDGVVERVGVIPESWCRGVMG